MDGHRVVDVFVVVVRYAVTRDLDSCTPVDGLRQTARWPSRTRCAEAKKGKNKGKKRVRPMQRVCHRAQGVG